MRISRKDSYCVYIICGVMVAAYFALTFILFYKQCVSYGGLYNSDMIPYIEFIKGTSNEYSFPYPLMFKTAGILSFFMPVELALSLVVTILNTLTLGAVFYYLTPILSNVMKGKNKVATFIMAGIGSLSLMFVSMIFLPGKLAAIGISLNHRCVGVFSPNPYWNATSLCARPFAIINFFSAARLLDTYEKEASWKEYFTFSLTLLLTTLAKPSYTLSICILFILIFAIRLIKARFRSLKKTFTFGIMFLPAGLDCIYQYSDVFSGINSHGEESGIAIGYGKAWHTLTNNIPLSILFAGAFAIWMFATNVKKIKSNTLFRLSWELYFVSLGIFLFLYEKGFRLYHCNFAWGYVQALFFVFLTGAIVLVQSTNEKRDRKGRLVTVISWLAYFAHLLCGVKFFAYMFTGGDFFLY